MKITNIVEAEDVDNWENLKPKDTQEAWKHDLVRAAGAHNEYDILLNTMIPYFKVLVKSPD